MVICLWTKTSIEKFNWISSEDFRNKDFTMNHFDRKKVNVALI